MRRCALRSIMYTHGVQKYTHTRINNTRGTVGVAAAATRVDRYGRQVVRCGARGCFAPGWAARPGVRVRFYFVHYFQLCQFKTQEALVVLLIELRSPARNFRSEIISLYTTGCFCLFVCLFFFFFYYIYIYTVCVLARAIAYTVLCFYFFYSPS